MKNIQVIDEAQNCVYDIFAAEDDEFSLIFPSGQDIAFADEVALRMEPEILIKVLSNLWSRRVRKSEAKGIHGILFYGYEGKKAFYPTRRDEEASNPEGTRLR